MIVASSHFLHFLHFLPVVFCRGHTLLGAPAQRSILSMDPSDEGSATSCKKHRDDMEYWLMHVYDPSVDVLDAEQARPVLHLKEKDAKNDEDENGARDTRDTRGKRGKPVVKRLKRSSGVCGMKKLLDFVDWYGRSVYVFNDIGSLEKVDAEVE